ncbi:hypothetical protein N5T57_06710 [Aliarcobacter cryaerophilus]|uniref:hypothetical protein n=1 Tax=Aliarcobacter cryaerophilus TaxID=28198 RepID=UPI0021B3475A|nr:hypothetical protein [Aliarcobacter cryaerophilus]MCT7522608.1 hypothetical protein [Aliarcobacter cryaerophilus]
MISPIQTGKTYGVLHTESFFSFLGFAKKVGSDEIQKIDVFLDDKLIDTIEANEFIQKIDDMYDVESKAFTYNLPLQYIGKKAIISFKNHDSGEELLNSPYTLIDKNHEKFNEANFINSINQPISEEMKNMYYQNSIGFLATKENFEDEEFMRYIKELITRFPNLEFVGFCFNKSISNTISKEIKLLEISSINEIILNTEIFIWDLKGKTDLAVVKYLLEFSNSIFNIFNFKNPYFINLENKSLKEYDKFYSNRGEIIITNPKKFGFSDDEIENTNRSYTKLMYESLLNRSSKDNFIIDLEQDALEFLQFKQIEFALKNRQFKEDFIKIHNIRNFK